VSTYFVFSLRAWLGMGHCTGKEKGRTARGYRELLEHLHHAALHFRCCDKKESHNPRSSADSHRFIPNREGQDLQASFSLLHDEGSPATPSKQKKRTPHGELHFQKSKQKKMSLTMGSGTDQFHSRRSEPDVLDIASL